MPLKANAKIQSDSDGLDVEDQNSDNSEDQL